MALTTGTYTNYGSEFHWPSGTIVYAAQVLGFPELSMGERVTTNHGSGGIDERRPNGLNMQGDFTLSILSTPDNFVTLTSDKSAGTERVCFLKNPVHTYLFTGWIKSVKEEDADGTSPDSVKATITVTPAGQVTVGKA
jgi:hypothetical protein